MTDLISGSKSYQDLPARLKRQIQTAQVRAALSVNRELVLLYWGIGGEIPRRQKEDGWGARVIDRLAKDLRLEFRGMQGFSTRNLKYMKAFAEAWREEARGARLVCRANHRNWCYRTKTGRNWSGWIM